MTAPNNPLNSSPGTVSVPYFAQWESPDLVHRFIHNPSTAASDPLWSQSGANSPAEYTRWSRHLCGIACLKMLLAAYHQRPYSTFDLMRLALKYGAYLDTQGEIKGLIYAPFLDMINKEFTLEGDIFTHREADELPGLLASADYLMVSVHPSIRSPQQAPPSRGGHLVLVTKVDIKDGVTFHNPSGDTAASQVNANLSIETFGEFFAGRGMMIGR